MKQLIIDRSKWRTGGRKYDASHGKTLLLNEEGNMCCLGFYCLQLGKLDENEIIDIGLPEDLVRGDLNADMLHLVHENDLRNTIFTTKAIEINDAKLLTNEQREKAIQEHFKQIDLEVVFTNDYNQ